jgi:(4-alkanoyl-5-oxo-2,5-dihydrofuran-3-yl)methyl phosphate reductase
MILVLGSTGTTGGEVARQLIQGGRRPRLLVRKLAKAAAFEGKTEILQGDLTNPESLEPAMKGVDKLYLVSEAASGPDLEFNAIDAAKKAGVKHVVKLSVTGVENPFEIFAEWHGQVEERLRDSGMAWTMLRPQHFMSNTFNWAQTIKTQGAFYQPTGEGRWAAVDPADIGAAAVKALTEPGHEGQAYTLSGPESLSAAQYAEKLSAAIGKPVRFVDIPLEAMRDSLLKSGMSTVLADALVSLMRATKDGKLDAVADGVLRATGRPPASFDDWARRHATAFQ